MVSPTAPLDAMLLSKRFLVSRKKYFLALQCSVVSLFAIGYVFLFYLTILDQDMVAYLIFVIFSPHMQFLIQFLSTQKCVNQDKVDCATNNKIA